MNKDDLALALSCIEAQIVRIKVVHEDQKMDAKIKKVYKRLKKLQRKLETNLNISI